MTEAVLAALARANLVAAVAILLVVALRKPARRALGAGPAYLLWSLPPLAVVAAFLPQLPQAAALPLAPLAAAAAPVFEAVARPASTPWILPALLCAWLAGAAAFAAMLGFRQARYMARARAGRAGPAVVGVLRPRIVIPADFEARFSAAERAAVLAHERVHLRRGDAAVNALAAALQCVGWFNPLVHLAVHLLRIDQELACDAAVMAERSADRRAYAEALLKSELAQAPLPLGCQWPPAAEHPLMERIAMLAAPSRSTAHRALGLAAVAVLTAGAAAAAWAAQPPAGDAPHRVAEDPAKVLARGDVPADSTPTLTDPQWTQRPGPEDIARLYPAAAARERLSARVAMTCRVGAGGAFDACSILRSEIVGATAPRPDLEMEFGTATLQLGLLFRAAPAARDGSPVAGRIVRIPVIWRPASPAAGAGR